MSLLRTLLMAVLVAAGWLAASAGLGGLLARILP